MEPGLGRLKAGGMKVIQAVGVLEDLNEPRLTSVEAAKGDRPGVTANGQDNGGGVGLIKPDLLQERSDGGYGPAGFR